MLRRTNPLAAALVAVALVHGPIVPASAASTFEPEASETPSEADTLSDEAVQAFKAHDYDTAIDKFQRAYDLDPQPNYKFNIGRVYEEKGGLENLEQAVKYYQEFVQSPGVDLESREAATQRLKVLRPTVEELRAQKAEADKAAGDPTTPTTDTADQPPVVDDEAKARKRKLRIAGYSLIGVGGLGLVIGSVFGGLALSKSKSSDDAPHIDDKISLRQEAKSRAAVADGMLITGGVLAGVGLILVLSTLGKGKRPTRKTAFLPSAGPQGAGLSWTGRF